MFVDCASFGRETSNGQQWDLSGVVWISPLYFGVNDGRAKFLGEEPGVRAVEWSESRERMGRWRWVCRVTRLQETGNTLGLHPKETQEHSDHL